MLCKSKNECRSRGHWVLVTILFNTIYSLSLELNSEPANMNETLDNDETLAECDKITMLQSFISAF